MTTPVALIGIGVKIYLDIFTEVLDTQEVYGWEGQSISRYPADNWIQSVTNDKLWAFDKYYAG